MGLPILGHSAKIMPPVPAYERQTRDAAQAAHQAADWTRSICTALGISQGPRFLYAAVFFELFGRVAQRIANDPARDDFTSSTRRRLTFATPEYIHSDDPAEQAALRAALAADEAEANLAAHLRAFERFQGAYARGRESDAAQRGKEATRYAHSSGVTLQNVSTSLLDLIASLGDDWGERQSASLTRRIKRVQPTDIDEETLAVLFLGGLRIRDLENILTRSRQPDPQSAPKHLSNAPKAFELFAERMMQWRPPSI